MQAGVLVVSVAAFVLLGFALVGGPMPLVDWFRKRRQTAIERQIALTDALDGQLGPIVAPLVKKPLFGPWEIQIAVPFHQSATVARILSVVDDVFSGAEGTGSRPYRIFLSAKPDSLRETRGRDAPLDEAMGRQSHRCRLTRPARLGSVSVSPAGVSEDVMAQPALRRGGDSHGHP